MDNTTREKIAVFRFSLYGFLKNQKYFEPFLILAFLSKGLSFFQIGLLVGFRQASLNILEIPSGAVADLYGRRVTMIFSFASYIMAFIVLAFSESLWYLFFAMFLLACGDSFRTGTHKAMIFDWLRAHGRENENTRVYGFTRSWSKLGSAVSAPIAAVLVFWRGDYGIIFLLCVIPYLAGVINFLGYPPETEGERRHSFKKGGIGNHLWTALSQAWQRESQRRLLFESMGFEGSFAVSKDYLQPVIASFAVALPFAAGLELEKRTAILVGIVYCVLHLLSSFASRHAHTLVKWRGGEDKATHFIWLIALCSYALLVPFLYFRLFAVATLIFILIHLIQNLWRPALVSRLNACSDPGLGATTMSIESQSKTIVTMLGAPLMGLAVDTYGLWPVGLLGVATSLCALSSGTANGERRIGSWR